MDNRKHMLIEETIFSVILFSPHNLTIASNTPMVISTDTRFVKNNFIDQL